MEMEIRPPLVKSVSRQQRNRQPWESHPDFVRPDYSVKEVTQRSSFLRARCVTSVLHDKAVKVRSRLKWKRKIKINKNKNKEDAATYDGN